MTSSVPDQRDRIKFGEVNGVLPQHPENSGADLPFHDVANLFPMMEGKEFEELKADIKAHGQRLPIWTWQGKVIDGRNRHRACRELGIKPKTQEWDGQGSLVAFIWSLNGPRRHLNSSQRA